MSFRAVVGREEWGGGDAGQGRPVSYCTSSNYTQVMSFTRVSTRTSTFIVPFIVYVRRVCSSPHCVTLYIYACSFPFLILCSGWSTPRPTPTSPPLLLLAVAGLKSTRMLLQSRWSRFLVFVDGVACVTAWDTTQEWGAVCSKPHAVCERSLPIYRTVKGPLTSYDQREFRF